MSPPYEQRQPAKKRRNGVWVVLSILVLALAVLGRSEPGQISVQPNENKTPTFKKLPLPIPYECRFWVIESDNTIDKGAINLKLGVVGRNDTHSLVGWGTRELPNAQVSGHNFRLKNEENRTTWVRYYCETPFLRVFNQIKSLLENLFKAD